jgi:hypothetical protein
MDNEDDINNAAEGIMRDTKVSKLECIKYATWKISKSKTARRG